jgi:hypothetical protein
MDKFLDTDDHPNLNQEDVDHLNRPIACNEIQAAIKSLRKKENPGPDEFYQNFTEEITATLLKLFHEIERGGTLPTNSTKPILHSTQNSIRTHQKQSYRPISLMNIDEKSSIKWQNDSNNRSEGSFTMTNSTSPKGCRDVSTYTNQ